MIAIPQAYIRHLEAVTSADAGGVHAMPRSLVRSCCAGGEGVVVDGGWSGVSGAGGFVASFDPVAVVAGPFDRAWAGAFTAGGDQQRGDPGEVAGDLFGPVLRGEWPPSRWWFGG